MELYVRRKRKPHQDREYQFVDGVYIPTQMPAPNWGTIQVRCEYSHQHMSRVIYMSLAEWQFRYLVGSMEWNQTLVMGLLHRGAEQLYAAARGSVNRQEKPYPYPWR